MNAVARVEGESVDEGDLFEAVVVSETEPGHVSLRRSAGGATEPRKFEARNAVLGYRPNEGDRVVCTAGPRGAYLTGVLVASPTSMELRAGDASARVEDGRLVVRAEGGELLVSYDPADGVTRVTGRTVLSTEGVLAIEAGERLELKAPEVLVETDRLTQRVADLVTEAVRVSTSTDRWDLRANKVTERARSAFRDVEGLLQTRAGTLRSIAREGMSLFARRTSVRSEKDTAIDGERVLLG